MKKLTFRILVVDDYEPWRRWVCSALQKQPEFQIVGEVSDGSDAVRKAQELQPELILLDVGLPTLNGIDAARRIRQHSSHSKILFFSNNRSLDVVEEALRTGAEGYVVKSDAASDLLPAVTAVFQGKQFVSRRFANHDFDDISDTTPREQGHVVQFYTDDTDLLDSLCSLFVDALSKGESVAAVMTMSHRMDLEARLIGRDIDIREATKNGRLVILDAHDALGEFMDAVGPNRDRFLARFGTAIRRAEAAAMRKGPVVVFGEMVAVLWAQRKYEAAIRLEKLWNELALSHSFYLCCAYPTRGLQGELQSERYAAICAEHSNVVSSF